jgi:hypothetical protein
MASAILVDHHGYRELYVTQENGDQNFTEEAQDLFEEYSSLVEGVLEGVGIGQDYDLAATENMVVVNADPNIDTLASSDLEMNVLQVAIDHMVEHLEDLIARPLEGNDVNLTRLEAAKRLKERLA